MDDDTKNWIDTILGRQYNVLCDRIEKAQAGWSALAYKVISKEKNYFLKVYDKHKYTAQSWIKRIDDYMPVLLWLEQNTRLKGKIPSVVLSVDKDYKYIDDDFIYILFEYIDGDNLSNIPLTKDLIKELAEIVAELHCIDSISITKEKLIETFDISFCQSLTDILQSGSYIADLEHILVSYSELILSKIKIYESLAEYLHLNSPNFVLCHTDIHRWNIMRDCRLKLIDWEGVRFAPAEADLFSFSEGFFFENYWDEFLTEYKKFHPVFQVNSEALRFYRLRRLLEDISSFTEGLMYNHLIGEERITSLVFLETNCLSLRDV